MQNNNLVQPGAAGAGQVNVDSIVARVRAGLPPQLQAVYDKAVLSGMRIMFDTKSHQLMLDALNQPGPMDTKLSNGIIQLMYLLWTQSNKTMAPQIIVPVTMTLTLKAFQFLQQSGDPQATKDVLGQATAEAVQGILDRFGATQDKIPGLLKSQGAGAPAATAQAPAAAAQAPAAGGGLLDSIGGA